MPEELTAAETWARWLRPRDYVLTRWLILRLLGVVYVFAFLGIVFQGLPLIGSHGLTPAATYVEHATFWQLPSVFVWNCSDTALMTWAYIGLAISLAVAVGYANLPMLLVLWFVYGSYERVGQLWWGFGWEIQILETTLLAAFLAHPWDPRPLRAPPPPTTSIVLMRWLVFRIMLGAGLIKLRHDSCWTSLTCLDGHFETQPIPNPLSPWFHHLPHAVHAGGVVFNHVVECVMPFVVFGPRPLRLIAGASMLAFQVVLILSGNLAFLNWLTIVPVLACFDDAALLRLVPRRWRDRLRARLPARIERNGWQLVLALFIGLGVILLFDHAGALEVFFAFVFLAPPIAFFANQEWRRWLLARLGTLDYRQLAIGAFAALVAFKSLPVIDNLTSHDQAMNRSYDRLELVNTYGAFGDVGMERHELIIEGTLDDDPATAHWSAYELPCKPGDVDRRPCVLGPYHRRLDWLIWFAAMDDVPREAWVIHVVWKLLDGDRGIRELLAVDPFDGKPPKWVRIRRFLYHFAPAGSSAWWVRDHETLWLEPVSLTTPGFKDALAQFGWPSPTLR